MNSSRHLVLRVEHWSQSILKIELIANESRHESKKRSLVP